MELEELKALIAGSALSGQVVRSGLNQISSEHIAQAVQIAQRV